MYTAPRDATKKYRRTDTDMETTAGPARRLYGLVRQLHPSRASNVRANDPAADSDNSTRLISWDEIQRHSMIEDAWVVIDGVVYVLSPLNKNHCCHLNACVLVRMFGTGTISPSSLRRIVATRVAQTSPWSTLARMRLSSGRTCSTKHATPRCNSLQCQPNTDARHPLTGCLYPCLRTSGHLQDEILEAIDSRDPGELSDLGLEALPVIVGLADGEAPASAKGAGFPSTNWAGNILWSASEVALPESVDELQQLVAAADGRVRCVGRSHSFTPAADTDGLLMSLARMQAILHFDDQAGRITVEGGATYTTINEFLQDKNWAVPNLATLPHFTVAGSISMGTHGSSGVGSDGRAKLGNQASQVSAIEFVLPDGSLKAYTREGDSETFDGVVVGLGCLGPISSITLDLTPRFNVVQAVYIDITVESVIKHFRDMVNNVDSFSWLVDWPKGEETTDMAALQGVVRGP